MRRAYRFLIFGPALLACSGGSSLGAASDAAITHDAGGHVGSIDAATDRRDVGVTEALDAGVDASHDAGQDTATVVADANGPADAAGDVAPPPTPVGTTLAAGTRFVVYGVTDDGHVVYGTPSSINAIPLQGGTPVVLGAYGFDDAGALGNGAVIVAHDLVFLWTNVTQFEVNAIPTGTLSVWTAGAAAPTVVSTSAIAPSPYGGTVAAASSDGTSFVYLVANTPSGEIAKLVTGSAANVTAGVTLDAAIGANPLGLCGPSLAFSGDVLFARYCEVVSGDLTAPLLFAFPESTWARETLLAGAVTSSVDGTGAYAAAISVGGQLELLQAGPDASAPVTVAPTLSLTSSQSVYLSQKDQFLLFTTPASALMTAPLSGSPVTSLVGANVSAIDGMSPDETWAIVNSGFDPNTGLPSDLGLANTIAPGAVRALAASTIAMTLGDSFTADSSYVLFATQVDYNLMTGAFGGATLSAAQASGTATPTVLSASAGYQVNALAGTKVIFADHFDPSHGLQGSVALHTIDVAGGSPSLVVAGADVTYSLTHDKSKLVYTVNYGEDTDGLYIVSLP